MSSGLVRRIQGRVRPRARTLRARVTVVASLGITAAAVAGLLLLYLLQLSAIRGTIDSQLRTYAAQIAETGQQGTWPNPLPVSGLDPGAQAQVVGPDGRVLAATHALAGQPATYVLSTGSDVPVRQSGADGALSGEVRVYGLRTVVAGQHVSIVTVTGTGLLSESSEEYIRHLLIGLPVILTLSAAAVWVVIGRALRPVERIRHAVTAITSADLSQRVPEPGTADEIGNLAATMNDMLARLDGAARQQRRFVADASHELRSPLATIRTTLEVGLAHPDRAPWPVIAARAARQTRRLEELIEQLLLLAKSDEQLLATRQEQVDLVALLSELRAHAVARQPELAVELNLAADLTVVGDPGALERMLRNVVDNALRYARTRVAVSANVNAESVRIHVDDDGPGVPFEDRERVFIRFVRLDASRERGSGSAGLGLAIVRETALAHGGQATITESPMGGARVSITLLRTACPPS